MVVPCRNEVKQIRIFLDSLLGQEIEGVEWEVIIADGMSGDGTREILEEYRCRHPRLQIVDNLDQIVSTGLNAAIRASRGQVIIRMDVHAEYAPNYIRRCLEELKRTGADNVGGPTRVKADSFRMRVLRRCVPLALRGWRV